jgi:hydrogenase maturation protease
MKREDHKKLLIGWGNELRGDDAAGRLTARHVALWHTPDIEVMDIHQLTPELSYWIANSAHVIFVDAYPSLEPSTLRLSPILPGSDTSVSSLHHVTPSFLVTMAHALYGQCPPALQIGIPALRMDICAEVSSFAQASVIEALDVIREAWALDTCRVSDDKNRR